MLRRTMFPQSVLISPINVVVIGHERNSSTIKSPIPIVILHFPNGTVVNVLTRKQGLAAQQFSGGRGNEDDQRPFENIIDWINFSSYR